MAIRVEFFGVARQRSGTAAVEIHTAGPLPLGVLLRQVAEQFPHWAAECLDGDHLHSSYLLNVDGNRFVHDPQNRSRTARRC